VTCAVLEGVAEHFHETSNAFVQPKGFTIGEVLAHRHAEVAKSTEPLRVVFAFLCGAELIWQYLNRQPIHNSQYARSMQRPDVVGALAHQVLAQGLFDDAATVAHEELMLLIVHADVVNGCGEGSRMREHFIRLSHRSAPLLQRSTRRACTTGGSRLGQHLQHVRLLSRQQVDASDVDHASSLRRHMSEPEDQVAGITFFLVDSSLTKNAIGQNVGRLTLDCQIHDEKLWPEVETKFREGHRIYTELDFHSEVIEVLRSELRAVEAERDRFERELRQAQEDTRTARAETEMYKKPLGDFGRALRGG
jgi:hypothetical protein